MFVPLSDDNPLRHIARPYVTILIIVVCVLAYAVESTPRGENYAASFALIPFELIGARPFGGPAFGRYDVLPFPEGGTLLTYMFLHGDPMHLAGNLLFLWVFGDNVEDALGHVRFLAFYLLCGVIGGLVHTAILPQSTVPLIGASGAVAGVVTAYLLLHPQVRVWIVAFRFIPLRITAAWALGAWILSQFVMAALPNVGPVAWWAHIGGIVAGAALVVVMRRPGVGLFGAPSPGGG